MSGFSAPGPSASDHPHPHPHPNQRPTPASEPAPVPESSNGSASASASGAASKQSSMPMSAGAADDDDDMASGSEHNTEQPYGAGGDGDEPGTGTGEFPFFTPACSLLIPFFFSNFYVFLSIFRSLILTLDLFFSFFSPLLGSIARIAILVLPYAANWKTGKLKPNLDFPNEIERTRWCKKKKTCTMP